MQISATITWYANIWTNQSINFSNWTSISWTICSLWTTSETYTKDLTFTIPAWTSVWLYSYNQYTNTTRTHYLTSASRSWIVSYARKTTIDIFWYAVGWTIRSIGEQWKINIFGVKDWTMFTDNVLPDYMNAIGNFFNNTPYISGSIRQWVSTTTSYTISLNKSTQLIKWYVQRYNWTTYYASCFFLLWRWQSSNSYCCISNSNSQPIMLNFASNNILTISNSYNTNNRNISIQWREY